MSTWMAEIRKHAKFHSVRPMNDPELLHPDFRVKVKALLVNAKSAGLKVVLYETFRSAERQLEMFNAGRSGLKSNGMHFYGAAADVVFLDGNGRVTWNVPAEMWNRLGALGKALGLYWGGDWKGRDCPHFQMVPATRAAQAKIVKGIYPKAA